MTHPAPALSQAQVDAFISDGFIRIDNAFSRETAAAARAILWRDTGCDPNDRATWTKPVVRLGGYHDAPFREAANTPVLLTAYDQLAGEGRWHTPQGLGTFPVRFPSDEEPGDDGWHVDVSFGFDNPDFMEWRVNVKSSGRALLMLFLFSDVGPKDAPTRIRVGSHRDIARQLLPYAEGGATLGELSADGYASTADCEQTLATGQAGTVYLCHPFLVHAAQGHRGTEPRFMAQPPLIPTGTFDPGLPPSPVQIAIRQACGLTF